VVLVEDFDDEKLEDDHDDGDVEATSTNQAGDLITTGADRPIPGTPECRVAMAPWR
jgi:hypothetical protein